MEYEAVAYLNYQHIFHDIPRCVINRRYSRKCLLWGSDNICIRKKKKFGGKKLAGAPVCGALAFLGGMFMQKWKMVGIGGKWSKIGFYFA